MKLAFLDTETTGLKAWNYGKPFHEIIELALIIVEDGETTFKKSYKFHPRRFATADPKALEICGYNRDVWKSTYPNLAAAFPKMATKIATIGGQAIEKTEMNHRQILVSVLTRLNK